jgi:sodium transport system ATP-binding protein
MEENRIEKNVEAKEELKPEAKNSISILQVKNIKKTFTLSRKQQKIGKTSDKKKVAVDNLSFECFPGEIYGLLGPNGAGKTTAMRVIATLIKADEGDVFVLGKSVKKEAGIVRKNIAFLTSELKLEDFFTPNFMYDFYSELHGVPHDIKAERKSRLFQKFGIDRFAEVKVGELSTGMKQKVSIAVSMAHEPDIIVYDEPTNGLDVITAKIVTDFLLDLRKAGKCIIVSTHIFSLIEKVCDRVGIIIDGKMAMEGALSDICAKTSLEDIFFKLYEETGGKYS